MAFLFRQSLAAIFMFIIGVGLSISSLPSVEGIEGIASFYTPPYVPSKCHGFQDDGTMIAAVRQGIFGDDLSICGKYYDVRCTGPTNLGDTQPCTGQTVRVKVVELCPTCEGNNRDIDLSAETFAIIAHPGAGVIKIDYQPA